MKVLFRILITAVLVVILSHLMPGVHVESFVKAIYVAIVLGLLNLFIKPILVILTLPITFITLGLFLLIINAILILICDNIVGGFRVDSFLTALLFSVILSVSQSLMYALFGEAK
ncbi:phage holin family protein [Flavobacterium frigidarium]|jgi:putative membrane protein|uniref:Phage holin family protein n=1 Tax=Flavobacterium frigidarium TaxID=99286 RepID=A0ABV4KEY7_9FLAO